VIRIGDFALTPLTDGNFRLDGGAMFGVVPKPLWQRRAPADEKNRISMSMRPLLVERHGDGHDKPVQRILIDAGCGDKMSEKEASIYALDRAFNLAHSLAGLGLTAADIDTVIASHLHFDHAGGFTTRIGDGPVVPRFPNAQYYIRQGEYDDATHPHERNRASYFLENYVPLVDAGVVTFHAHDEELVPGIRAIRTGGHTMHHEMIKIESDGRTAIFAADLLPTTAHVDDVWIMGYDLYPMDTLAFKRRFVREAIEREYVIFFEHDPEIAAGIIREEHGKRRVEPIAGL
jgi:glyoxylase-like metal-dependent hydrolase (beta-lactamase superfamily II)